MAKDRTLEKVAYHAQNYLKNHEQNKAIRRAYVKANPEIYAHNTKKYEIAKKNATPKWLTASDKIEIRWASDIAREWTKARGKRYEVDHIVPIQGKNVCGLHVPWNLTIITSTENKMKKARI